MSTHAFRWWVERRAERQAVTDFRHSWRSLRALQASRQSPGRARRDEREERP